MSINKVFISGNLTRNSELRSTGSGMTVLQFGVAVNDRRRDPQSGEWVDYPNFIDCTMFGTRAEKISTFLVKGAKVFIEGKLRWSQWEKDGQKRSKIEIIVDEIEFNPRQNSGQNQGQNYNENRPTQAPQTDYGNAYASRPQAAQSAAQTTYTQQQVPMYQQGFGQPPQQQYNAASLYDEDVPF